MLVITLLAPLARNARRRWLVASMIGVAVTLAGTPLHAHGADAAATDRPVASLDAALVESVKSLALEKSGDGNARRGGPPARVEVVVGQLDPRLRLAPCQKIEPYLPAGVRLWGKSRIGLRCVQGPTAWNVYLPITVQVFGRALVVAGGAAAGSPLAAADLAEAEVDLAEEQTAAIADPALAVGRVLAQSLKPGQTLRAGHLKLRQYFAAGETVKIVAVGAGFSLESEAQALTAGVEGTPARVRTESGRILTGVPAGERRVEVSL